MVCLPPQSRYNRSASYVPSGSNALPALSVSAGLDLQGMDDCTFESSFRKVSHPPQPFHLRPILASRVFCVVEGYLVSSECQTLGNPETVLGRKSVYPYNVLSCRYYFKNAQFYLNQGFAQRMRIGMN